METERIPAAEGGYKRITWIDDQEGRPNENWKPGQASVRRIAGWKGREVKQVIAFASMQSYPCVKMESANLMHEWYCFSDLDQLVLPQGSADSERMQDRIIQF